MPRLPLLSPGISTSLDFDGVQITPRTPRPVRPDYADADTDNFVSGVDEEEVEMGLLAEDERARAHPGFANGTSHLEAKHRAPLSLEDKRAMALLCVLCMWLPPLPSFNTHFDARGRMFLA